VAIDASKVVPDDGADIVAVAFHGGAHLAAACFVAEVGRLWFSRSPGSTGLSSTTFPFACQTASARDRAAQRCANHDRQVDSLARVRDQPGGGDLQPDRSRGSRLAYSAHRRRHRGGGPPGSRYGAHSGPRTITGPDVIRLPELTSKMLDAQGDHVVSAPRSAIGRPSRRCPAGTAPRRGDRSDHRHLARNHQGPGCRSRSQSRDPHIGKENSWLNTPCPNWITTTVHSNRTSADRSTKSTHSKHHATYVKGANDALAKL